jgi:hypothetical protein
MPNHKFTVENSVWENQSMKEIYAMSSRHDSPSYQPSAVAHLQKLLPGKSPLFITWGDCQ